MWSKGAMAEKDVQSAEDVEAKAKVDLQTALDRIQLLGGDTKTLQPFIDTYYNSSDQIILLPPLADNAQYLKQTGILQKFHNVQGI